MARMVIAAAALAALAFAPSPFAHARPAVAVVRVVDGDTLVLSRGTRVRLVQIDSPEVGSGECYSRRAAEDLRRLLPPGTPVALRADPLLDRVDRFGRLLRYVFRGRLNVNLALVARGDATVWFYEGARGRYARTLVWAGARARRLHRGLWGACRAAWNPYAPATTSTKASRPVAGRRCDPSYPGVCIPPPPPDLDCRDVRYRNFRVLPPDPHHFDGNHDGRGCERW